jgi:hypothetical protein
MRPLSAEMDLADSPMLESQNPTTESEIDERGEARGTVTSPCEARENRWDSSQTGSSFAVA